jgi:AAA family ATP:ADP antiporter
VLDRLMKVFSDVRPGESRLAILMAFNLFLALAGYYIIKTVREPLILASGGAEMKSYAAAAQAILLMGLIPLYSWFSSTVERLRLIRGVIVFFIVCIEIFYVGAMLNMPYLGFLFFVWVGIYSLSIIAQFWSYANDLYSREDGERLFPIIAVGATVGSVAGAKFASVLFDMGVSAYSLMQVTAGMLVLHLLLYMATERMCAQTPSTERQQSSGQLSKSGGFALVFKSRYITLIAVLLILLNLVNTTGEYILGKWVVMVAEEAKALDAAVDIQAFIGSFYGDFFFWVNLATVVVQAFLVSRIVKYLGMPGVVLALPILAMGAYALVASGVGFAVMRWAKTAENTTDYSVMNTAKALLWLPTTRDEKYKAKQAVDTFFVRFGDLISAGLVFAGTTWLQLGIRGFAAVNIGIVLLWIGVALLLLREHKRLKEVQEREGGADAA